MGHRVSELENKLRTIESSGLWSAARVRQDRILCIQEELTDILNCSKDSDDESERNMKLFKHYNSETNKSSSSVCSHRCAIHTASGTVKASNSDHQSTSKVPNEVLDPLADEKLPAKIEMSSHGKERVLEKFLSSIDSQLSQDLDENVFSNPVETSKTGDSSERSRSCEQNGAQSGSCDSSQVFGAEKQTFEEVVF